MSTITPADLRALARSYFTESPEARLAAAETEGFPALDEVLRFVACASDLDHKLIRRVDMRRGSELSRADAVSVTWEVVRSFLKDGGLYPDFSSHLGCVCEEESTDVRAVVEMMVTPSLGHPLVLDVDCVLTRPDPRLVWSGVEASIVSNEDRPFSRHLVAILQGDSYVIQVS